MSDSIQKLSELTLNQRRAIRGWCMYDWANSAFATSASVAILPVYFVLLFKGAFGEEVNFLSFTLTGSSLWSLGIAISTLFVAITSPILGIIADRAAIKKTLLIAYTIGGATFTVLIFFSAYTGAAWAWVLGSFILANVGFAGGLVFYNSMLPALAPARLLDEVSSKGFAYGYIGGGLLLAIHLVLIILFQNTAHADLVTRLVLASVGIWWFGWAIWTFRTVPEPITINRVENLTIKSSISLALTQLTQTFRNVARFRVVAIYLAAYLLFNDGIQTVLTVAGAFAADTLGISLTFNMATILIIQFVAAPGAMWFSWLASKTSTKNALSVALAGWCIVILFGIGIAPLAPQNHADHDYQLDYNATNDSYKVTSTPELSETNQDINWTKLSGHVTKEENLTYAKARNFTQLVNSYELSRFSVSVMGGPLDGIQYVGDYHKSKLTIGPVDWWPRTLRNFLWYPLGLSADLQWLLLGSVLGIVMGGSQALARSLFAYITPETRSGEFFGFFGFVSRASAVFGPMIYVIFTSIYDTRIAILAILVIILAGTIILRCVDVKRGREVAIAEDNL